MNFIHFGKIHSRLDIAVTQLKSPSLSHGPGPLSGGVLGNTLRISEKFWQSKVSRKFTGKLIQMMTGKLTSRQSWSTSRPSRPEAEKIHGFVSKPTFFYVS